LKQRFQQAIEERVRLVKEYVMQPEYLDRLHPEDMREAVTCYFESGGKRLRPAVLLFCVGAVSGNEEKALCAAAATEIFHTWTLVHDDIIDRDPVRRGAPTVHERFRVKPATRALYGGDDGEARHYGLSVAVLAGDVQHGWGISLMTELSRKYGLAPEVTLMLINTLDTRVLCTLVEGEMLDVQYSRIPVEKLTLEQVESMLWKKTGALYEFCGEAGACIGLNCADLQHPLAQALGKFCSACGTAFQLQDDILGIVGNERMLGKPVGSDIREGKRTLIVLHAYQHATPAERKLMLKTLGNSRADADAIATLRELFVSLGSITDTAEMARARVDEALTHLAQVPPSPYRDLLQDWAEFMIEREF
jgi:geranylgeranyl diphosphate synthase type I